MYQSETVQYAKSCFAEKKGLVELQKLLPFLCQPEISGSYNQRTLTVRSQWWSFSTRNTKIFSLRQWNIPILKSNLTSITSWKWILDYDFVLISSFSVIWSQMKIWLFLSIQDGKGDYHSDLYSAWSIWPIRTAASSLAVKLRLTNLWEIPFHILLKEILSFKLRNVVQGSWN